MVRHVVIWLVVVVFMPLFLPYVMPPKSISIFIRQDYKEAISILGNKKELNDSLVGFYKTNLKAISGFVNEFRDSHDDSDEFMASGDGLGERLAEIPGQWAEAVKLEVYSMTLKIVILQKWSFWLLTPVLTGFFAGYYNRRLKSETFSAPIPPIYNGAVHTLIALFFMFVLWLLCPFPLPLSIIPTLSMLAGTFISLSVSNFPNYQ